MIQTKEDVYNPFIDATRAHGWKVGSLIAINARVSGAIHARSIELLPTYPYITNS